MALPATESFTSATPVNLANPPWFLATASPVKKDGLGHGTPSVTTGGDCLGVWISDAFANDHYSQFTAQFVGLGTGVDYIDLVVRCTSTVLFFGASGKGYFWQSDGGSDTTLYSVVGGAGTPISSAPAVTFTIGDVFKLQAVGTTISCLKNGSSINSATSSTIPSGSAAMGGAQTTATSLFNTWIADNIASSFQPAWAVNATKWAGLGA